MCHGQLQSLGTLSFPSRASFSHRRYYLREIPQLPFSFHSKYITVSDSSHALVCSGFTHLTAWWSLTRVPTRQPLGRVCPVARMRSLQLSLFLPFPHWAPSFLSRSVTKMAQLTFPPKDMGPSSMLLAPGRHPAPNLVSLLSRRAAHHHHLSRAFPTA